MEGTGYGIISVRCQLVSGAEINARGIFISTDWAMACHRIGLDAVCRGDGDAIADHRTIR